MALTAREKTAVLAAIGAVLQKDIHEELLYFYAAAVSHTEALPEQVNNEMRNAITHFARAVCAEDKAAADSDVAKGRGHIDRAKRDALKLGLLALHDKIQKACSEIVLRNGTIAPAFTIRRDGLTAQRAGIFLAEARGDTNILDLFTQMYLDADALYKDLVSTHHLLDRRLSRWQLIKHAITNRTALVLTTSISGLAIGVLAFLLCAYFWPDPAALSKSLHAILAHP